MTIVRRIRSWPALWLDIALATVVGITGVIEFVTRIPDGDSPGAVAFVAAAYAFLALRRRRPLVAGIGCFAFFIAAQLLFVSLEPVNVPLFAVLIVSYSMARYSERREAFAGLALTVAALITVVTTMTGQSSTDFFFPTSFAVIAWIAGRAVRTRAELTEQLHEAAALAEEAHEHELARAATEERRRIAREMHDIVAHSVSVMVVQAGGARRILEQDPARAIEAAVHIEETGRAALVEMRRLLGMLGQHEDTRAPQPTLASLDGLVERARAAGLPVDVTVEGAPVALPAGLDLAAYRVVQEGLTNAIRHAPGSPTEVRVNWQRDVLELAVRDRGPGAAARRSGDGGHGLVGMQERVRLYGGELWTGQRSGGGFEIRARIPLEPDPEVQPA
jgi:signal transduction histidine kinase